MLERKNTGIFYFLQRAERVLWPVKYYNDICTAVTNNPKCVNEPHVLFHWWWGNLRQRLPPGAALQNDQTYKIITTPTRITTKETSCESFDLVVTFTSLLPQIDQTSFFSSADSAKHNYVPVVTTLSRHYIKQSGLPPDVFLVWISPRNIICQPARQLVLILMGTSTTYKAIDFLWSYHQPVWKQKQKTFSFQVLLLF